MIRRGWCIWYVLLSYSLLLPFFPGCVTSFKLLSDIVQAMDIKPGSLNSIVEKAATVGWKMVNTGGEIVTLVDGRRAVYLRDGRDGFTVELFEGR